MREGRGSTICFNYVAKLVFLLALALPSATTIAKRKEYYYGRYRRH